MDKSSAIAYHFGDMGRAVNRRDLLKGGFAAGAALALPARLLAQDLEGQFDGALGARQPVAPVPTVSSPVV